MKKSVKYVIGILFSTLLLGGMTACGESRAPDLPQLSSPTDLYLSINLNYDQAEYLFTWDMVKEADSYTISVDGNAVAEDIAVYTEEYDLTPYLTAGTQHEISIISVTEYDEYVNSTPAILSCTAEIPTANIQYTYNREGYEGYAVSRGTANLKGRLVIPDMYNGLEVVKVAENAFGRLPYLNAPPQPDTTSVRLPRGIKVIGEGAFNQCINLKEINFPENLEKIANAAFVLDPIEKVTLPQNLSYIEDAAFKDCILIEEITIPNVVYLGTMAFYGCEKLVNVIPPKYLQYMGWNVFHNTAWYDSQPDGYVYFSNVLYGYKGEMPENTVLESYPDYIDRFACSAFRNCNNLVSVTIPQSWKTISTGVFLYCTNLKTVNLPDSLKTINDSTFLRCSSLESIIIPDNVIVIEDCAFQGCSNLKSIVLPKSLNKIGEVAFFKCNNLTEIYYKGTQTDWDKIQFYEEDENPPNNATVYFYSESEPPLNEDGTAYRDNYWHYAEDGITPVVWEL